MSRVGFSPIPIPPGTQVTIEGALLKAKGKLGEMSLTLHEDVNGSVEDDKIYIRPRNSHQRARAMWGTYRAQAANIVKGVSEGWSKKLEISGVGYRASVEGKNLKLQLGYSHDVIYPIPDGIEVKCERPTLVTITGHDKQQVGQVAAEIRAWRPPEPYKGKGVKYEEEYIFRKEGKKK
ncbi:MAG TPA: 50S ribosomal protein L6 [Alphaproteobacteria bacterium]|nr:50S ribosomal protein L6 [Alphaproteobacteria bacterium]